eukprot:CAMPEP_0119510048 /NCGR_PEP_ID=MMETSP1344-20130328/29143_1 /TAXON_ID=236787 /ORGANISM="Florenciella parvula, Strain CCMP2471" /LENGTH=67 /DNA_ID=CAMNT_0007546939 /DNA_START=237 /DNA_END=437 /DNA_ORIENTATION=+
MATLPDQKQVKKPILDDDAEGESHYADDPDGLVNNRTITRGDRKKMWLVALKLAKEQERKERNFDAW